MIYSSAKDVAKFFLNKESMTHKKLQKLVYYAYAWTLFFQNNKEENVINNQLFNDKIEAWTHGPVVSSLYQEYKRFGWSTIPKETCSPSFVDHPDVLDILNEVYRVYGKYDADQLENLSHSEKPWQNAHETVSHKIDDKSIFEYFYKLKNEKK